MPPTIDIKKPAYNEEYRTVQFRRPDGKGQLNAEETVVSCEVLCTEVASGADRSTEMIADVSPYDGTQVKYQLKGGVPGLLYLLRFRVTSSNGQKLEEQAALRIY